MTENPSEDEDRTKAAEGMGIGLGVSAVALLLLILPAIFKWGTTVRTILFALALLIAAVGIFGTLNDLGKLLRRPSLDDFGVAAGLAAIAAALIVARSGFGIDGLWGGIVIGLAIAVLAFGIVGAGMGLGRFLSEGRRAAALEAAASTEGQSSAEPHNVTSPPVPRRSMTRGEKWTVGVTLFVGILTAAATLIGPLLVRGA